MLNKGLVFILCLVTTACSITSQESTPPVPATNTATQLPVNEVKTPPVKVTSTSKVECDEVSPTSHKMTIGQVENFTLVRENRSFDARIDTGATTSSLGVFNIVRFERDGDKWVKFTLDPDIKAKGNTVFEYPLSHIVEITNPGHKATTIRPVIKMKISLAGKNYISEFTLNDRSHMTYKLLIGREFLRDRAVVDVSHKFLMKGE